MTFEVLLVLPVLQSAIITDKFINNVTGIFMRPQAGYAQLSIAAAEA